MQIFDLDKFFNEHPMPTGYDNAETSVSLIDHGVPGEPYTGFCAERGLPIPYRKYSVMLENPNLPCVTWSGEQWLK